MVLNHVQAVKNGIIILFLLLAIAGMIVPHIIGTPRLAFAGAFFTTPLLAGTLLFLLLTQASESSSKSRQIKISDVRLLVIVFFIAIAITGFDLVFSGNYSGSYLTLIALSIAALTVFIQVMFLSTKRLNSQRTTVAILLQLGLFIVVTGWRITLRYPMYYGSTDVFPHTNFIHHILEFGRPAVGIYESYALFHILSATTSSLISVTATQASYILTGIILATTPTMVYLFARLIYPKSEFALLTAALSAIFPTVLSYTLYSIPRGIIPAFALLLLTIHFIKIQKYKQHILMTIFLVTIVAWHPSSFPFLFIVFGLIYVAQVYLSYITKQSNRLTRSSRWGAVLILFSVITIAQWGFVDGLLLEEIVGHIVSAFAATSSDIAVESGQGDIGMSFLNNIHWTLFILATVLGTLFCLSDNRKHIIPFIAIGAILLMISVPGPVQALGVVDSLNFRRFSLYTFPFIIFACSYGLLRVRDRVRPSIQITILVPLVLIGIFLVLASPAASTGALLFADNTKNHLTEPEAESYDFAEMYATEIHADYVTIRYFRQLIEDESSFSGEINANTVTFQASDEPGATLIIRHGETYLEGVNFRVTTDEQFSYWYSGTTFDTFYPDSPVWDTIDEHCKIYDSEEVEMNQCMERTG